MNKRIKKKKLDYAIVNEIFLYVKDKYNRGCSYIFVPDEVYDNKYGYIYIAKKHYNKAKNMLRKFGYKASCEKMLSKYTYLQLGRSGYNFYFKR